MSMLNDEAALKFAKEFTITAMEHSIIAGNVDPSKAADNVYIFYKTLFEKLSGSKDE